jgi:hypothetical protein
MHLKSESPKPGWLAGADGWIIVEKPGKTRRSLCFFLMMRHMTDKEYHMSMRTDTHTRGAARFHAGSAIKTEACLGPTKPA